MVGEVMASLSAFKTMYDMAKALKDINDATIRNGAVIELQQRILEAQAAQSALMERTSELETEVARLKAWDADKQRYKLATIGEGMAAYTMKDGMENGEPAHYLCANCYHAGHKSIMQTEIRNPGRSKVLVCHLCGSDLYVQGPRSPEHHAMKRSPGR